MNSIAIIGSNLIGLLCADILSEDNEVTIMKKVRRPRERRRLPHGDNASAPTGGF